MTENKRPDLAVMIDAALAAGSVIMEIYQRAEISVEYKADASPLTEADLAAEAVILEALKAAYPTIEIVAEEAAAAGVVPECGARFFLVDPLDGSKEFIERNGEFTVNIAFIEHGIPVAGVVYAPALDRIWWGAQGSGSQAARVEGGQLKEIGEITVRRPPAAGLTLVGSRSHGGGASQDRLERVAIGESSAVGSSLKFCLLAEGSADIYPRLGRTMEWDTAAGDAILRAAGGVVVDDAGAVPLVYGKRNQGHDVDFANPSFWALSHSDMIVLVARRDE